MALTSRDFQTLISILISALALAPAPAVANTLLFLCLFFQLCFVLPAIFPSESLSGVVKPLAAGCHNRDARILLPFFFFFFFFSLSGKLFYFSSIVGFFPLANWTVPAFRISPLPLSLRVLQNGYTQRTTTFPSPVIRWRAHSRANFGPQ